MVLVFLSEALLVRSEVAGRAALVGDRLHVRAPSSEGCTLAIEPAVYFEQVEVGEVDPHDVVGSVRTERDLAPLGAEHLGESVVMGEHAYRVRNGVVGQVVTPGGTEVALDGSSWEVVMTALETL